METGTTVLDKMRRVLWLVSLRSCDNSILEQNLRIWQGNAGGSGKCFSLLPCEKSSEIWTGCECWKVSVHTSLAQTRSLENKPPVIILVLNILQSLGLFFPAIRNHCDTGHGHWENESSALSNRIYLPHAWVAYGGNNINEIMKGLLFRAVLRRETGGKLRLGESCGKRNG